MKLFEPLTIKNIELKNRIVMAPMQLMLGLQNRRVREFFLERARGGAGAIIMQGTSVDLFLEDEAWGRPGTLAELDKAMKSLTDDIRNAGARVGIQPWHGNQFPAGSGAPVPGSKLVAPSAVNDMQEMSIDEIQSVVEKFASASEKAKEWGFDFVDLHGAHGYLLCQFFSGADNRRKDEYGGDINGRMRLGLETVKAVRKAVGGDYPIFYRLGAEEEREHGITIEQSKLFASELEKAGVDVIDVSVGRNTGLGASPGEKADMGTFVYLAEAIKQSVNIPVIAVGRINTAGVAESVLTQKRADLVAVGRQLLADPYWPQKIHDGRESEIIACESCNTCFRPLMSGKWKPGDRICKVNERAGREIDK